MGIFGSNVHMNGAGTTYQSFLDLADEAEQKGGKIGDRTVRLVKAGDGLATTTFHGTTGARADQIGGARKAFLDAIAQEFGYTARSIAEKTLADAVEKLQQEAVSSNKALSAGECKASLLGRVESKFLEPCRKAAAEIEASALDSAQKKAFLSKVMAYKVDTTLVRMALRTAPAFDAGALVAAAKSGNGAKLAEELFNFVAKIHSSITAADERDAIYGAEEYSSFMATSADLLFILNPEITDGVRNLDDGVRGKLFDDAGEKTAKASSDIQNRESNQAGAKLSQAASMSANHWSSASSCIMQLRQAAAGRPT